MLKNKKNTLLFFLGLFLLKTSSSYANLIIPKYDTNAYTQDVKFFYEHALNKYHDLATRVDKTSEYFVGKKYLLGALGEGVHAQYDKSPLFRTDAFDCQTYVSTVMALACSDSFEKFLSDLKKIQYQHADVVFEHRNHFTEVDWNTNNQQLGFLKDITKEVSSSAQVAKTWIDKPEWFRHLGPNTLKYFSKLSQVQEERLLQQLHDYGNSVQGTFSEVTYIPLSVLFKRYPGTIVVNQEILQRIPTGSIIEIVDKNRQTRQQIGTDLNIAHLGFAISKPSGLFFRHASELKKKVVDVPFVDYFKKRFLLTNHPEKIGIHIEKILSVIPTQVGIHL